MQGKKDFISMPKELEPRPHGGVRFKRGFHVHRGILS